MNMSARTLPARLRRTLRRSLPLQLGLIALFWLAGCALVRLAGLPVPGAIAGLLLLLALLSTGRLPAGLLRKGAGFLLAQMLLFFVPAVVVLRDHPEFLGTLGLKVLLVILGSTAVVMITTGLTVDLYLRWRNHHAPPATVLE